MLNIFAIYIIVYKKEITELSITVFIMAGFEPETTALQIASVSIYHNFLHCSQLKAEQHGNIKLSK